MHILVTGATGYVGTRLIPELLKRGHRVRCLARHPERLRLRPWFDQVEVVAGDVLIPAALPAALAGIDAAYYLIHSMASGARYEQQDRMGAQNFGAAAHAARIKQIIYLGGLGESGHLSQHMQSRQETGAVLRASGVPTIELRASVIIGSGSISFEMIRFLTNWFPFVIDPRPTRVHGQPIAIYELLAYLIAALASTEASNKILEIGGLSQMTYPEMMWEYAKATRLPRRPLPIPFFEARLAAFTADLLTPVPYAIARPLMGELVTASIVHDQTARDLFPAVELSSYTDSIERALARAELPSDSPWMESLVTRRPLAGTHVRTLGEGLLIEYRERRANWSRGTLEGQIALQPGWMIAAKKDGEWIRLRRARVLPGVLYREFQLKSGALREAILFEPRGLMGMLFWYFNFWRRYVC